MKLQESLRSALLLYREDSGKTQEMAAEELNISVEYYKQFESGKGNPTLKFLARIHICFGISIDALIEICNEFVIQDLQEDIKNTKKKKIKQRTKKQMKNK